MRFHIFGGLILKQVIFSEEQLKNLDDIGKELFSDEQNPRSSAYIRKLSRPKISLLKTLLLYILFPVLTICVIIVLLNHFGLAETNIIIIAVAILVAYILLTTKQLFICTIKLYQKYAPDSLRNKCRFEPSCSDYMILAIEKYGLIKGLQKGICRLKRCNIDNGGYDFP